MSPRSRILLAVVVLLVLVAAVGAWYFFGEEEDAEVLELYGNVEVREVVLAFRVPGRIAETPFQEGDAVAAGDVLARLDPVPFEQALDAAEGTAEAARARLAKLESGFRPQEIRQAEAEVRRAEAAYENATKNHRRKLGLLDSGASSRRQVDAAEAARDEAEARLAAAREALALLREGFRNQDVDAARAELRAAEAGVAAARTRLDDALLVAPNDGRVLTKVHHPGAVVGAGTPVVALSLEAPTYVRAYVAEPNLGHVAPGTTAWVLTDTSDERFEGQVGFVSPRAEFTPRMVQTEDLRTDLVYRLRIVVPGAPKALRQGMPVTVHVPLADEEAGDEEESDGEQSGEEESGDG